MYKLLIVLLLSTTLVNCGTHISSDKIEAEAEIDHRIRFDLSNIENYFRAKCADEFYEEYGYKPTPTDSEVAQCTNLKMAEFVSISKEVTTDTEEE